MASQQVIPMLSYEDGTAAMDWLCRVFGFEQKERMLDDRGKLIHGEIILGDGIIMLASPSPDYQSPKRHRRNCESTRKFYEVPWIINGVLVYVEDLISHYEKAKQEGAVILSEPEDDFPGLRYRAEDLEGQRWMFMERS
ncbi:MAG TPA: VOC family protein [Cyclobacteriaceae bacterium]|nr:VOC family protein [Cyclobacteriaceae bacterium]